MDYLKTVHRQRLVDAEFFLSHGSESRQLSFPNMMKFAVFRTPVPADVGLTIECLGREFTVSCCETGKAKEGQELLQQDLTKSFVLEGSAPGEKINLRHLVPVIVGRSAFVHVSNRIPLPERYPDLAFAVENTGNNEVRVFALGAEAIVSRNYTGLHVLDHTARDGIAWYNASVMRSLVPMLFGGILPDPESQFHFCRYPEHSRYFRHDNLIPKDPILDRICERCAHYAFGMLFNDLGKVTGYLSRSTPPTQLLFGANFAKGAQGPIRVLDVVNPGIFEKPTPYEEMVESSVGAYNRMFTGE